MPAIRRSRLRSLGVLACVFVLTACATPPSDEDPPPADPFAPGAHVWTATDGATVPYSVSGSGDVTVVLVHCWMCDRTFWDAQVPVLADRYRVVVLDLPGHGASTGERRSWTVGGYGEDVAGLLADLDLEDVVLVGHSMGGPVSLRAAALSPGRVRGIVAVDTLHDAEFEFSAEQVEGMTNAFESDFSGTCADFVTRMFPEEGSGELVSRVIETSCSDDRVEVGVALMRDFGRIDMDAWFSEAGVPIRAINAAAANPTRVEANREYADFDAVLLDDVGHYLHMTRPGAFNPLLLGAIEEVLEASR